MKLGKKGKIATNVTFGNIILILFCIFIGSIGIIRIQSINIRNKQVYEKAIVPIDDITSISIHFQRILTSAKFLDIEPDIDGLDAIYNEIQNSTIQIDKYVDEIKQSTFTGDFEKAFDYFQDSRETVITSINHLYELKKNGENVNADKYYNEVVEPALEVEYNAIHNIRVEKLSYIEGFLESNIALSNKTGRFIFILVLLATIVGVAIILFLLNSLKELKEMVKIAQEVSKGNFDIKIEKSSNNEVGDFARSFENLLDKCNLLLANISSAANQVEAGSAQVSDSSMSLSQGTSEQASAIEELSASLEQISSKIKENDETSQMASTMSATVKEQANNGNHYMQDLVSAMRTIDESSKNISKVIKVIDDIAFQTNILALNAAVEAARAGQYGRGFAVVADEVRNLAAKSAAAVEETSSMIDTSLQKISIGADKAELTAKAFNDILVNINELSEYGKKVALSSQEQSKGIQQINQGIQQISDVVQSTSATAEETAAASEELSSQSTLLRKQISFFKIRKNVGMYSSIDENSMAEIKRTRNSNWNRLDRENLAELQNNVNNINLSDSEFGKY